MHRGHVLQLEKPKIYATVIVRCSSNAKTCAKLPLQENGSLRDLLSNETVVLEGELLFPIVKDICQGGKGTRVPGLH